ncbi:CoA-binding domain protein [Acidimicrobium ferrooxidans DSM 10331]|uniref:CoA-binding domain protein n=1 Tax=Acidimicrobium ferrooxidans (strain DSM 10331 / JCM 15462 / NBRC 103882 / ICP) TaxID=525909 RepID=C7M1K1_ACIFD|nr:CoA-binding protein [Acidimicrobium ferrooxidans]ACU53050.1 CoA-binding domain protein [Acidimicrobium ferrooxidans DSM 10331]
MIVIGAEQPIDVLRSVHTIAMVGASSNPWRASHHVMAELLDLGYEVLPVNPRETMVHDLPAYPTLEAAAAEHSIDLVDVFRRPEACPAVARAAVGVGARALWLQLGIVSDEAAAIAREGGLIVVMDDCPSRYVTRLRADRRPEST